MLSNEDRTIYCKRVGLFYANFSLELFCAFLLEYSVTSQVTFSRFPSPFPSDLNCSHSEAKPVSKRKVIAA